MKEVLNTNKAPQAIGPYSQGISGNGFLFFSGQIPLKPDGSSLTDSDIETQTKCVMENIKGLLNEAGKTFDDIVKTTIYITDMNDFSKLNEIYGKYFNEKPPARSTVAVAALPRNAKVEIECIVHL